VVGICWAIIGASLKIPNTLRSAEKTIDNKKKKDLFFDSRVVIRGLMLTNALEAEGKKVKKLIEEVIVNPDTQR
jgi:hypothetical protein